MKYSRVRCCILWTPLLMAACGVIDVHDSNPLLGTRFNQDFFYVANSESDTSHYLSRLELTFDPNLEFETIRMVFDASTGSLPGYRFASSGRYSVDKYQLTMTTEKRISSDDTIGLYSREKLQPIPVSPQVEKVTFEIDGDKLVLRYLPCGPRANCIRSITFERKNDRIGA